MSSEDQALAILEMIEEKRKELIDAQVAQREILREMHQATKDAAAARRGLLDALGKYDGDLGKHFAGQVEKMLTHLTEVAETASETLAERMTQIGKASRDHIGEVLGKEDAAGLMSFVANEMLAVITPKVVEATCLTVERLLPDIIRRELGIAPPPTDIGTEHAAFMESLAKHAKDKPAKRRRMLCRSRRGSSQGSWPLSA